MKVVQVMTVNPVFLHDSDFMTHACEKIAFCSRCQFRLFRHLVCMTDCKCLRAAGQLVSTSLNNEKRLSGLGLCVMILVIFSLCSIA